MRRLEAPQAFAAGCAPIRPQVLAVASRRSRVEKRAMERWRLRSLLALAASAIYLYGFPSATITYGTLVLLHVAVGILFTILLFPFLVQLLRLGAPLARVGWLLLAAGAVLGIVLIFIGALNRLKPWLYAHIAFCVVGCLFVATAWLASRGWLGSTWGQHVLRFA